MPDSDNPPVIDLNILPAPYRPRVAPPFVRILWVVAILFLLVSLPLLFLSLRDREAIGRLEDELAEAESTLRVARTPPQEIIALREEISRSMELVAQVETLYPIMEDERRDWPPIFTALADYDPQRIRLIEMTQRESDLTVVGLARARDDVLSYASRLERSGAFSQVSIQSMEVVTTPFDTPTPAPTATPTGTLALTPTPSPGTPVPTPLPPPYDAYEPDDLEPGEIGIGESQARNFYPQWDVDAVRFLGKAGRRYCVMALPQAVGVDPILEVGIGTKTLENDDCAYSASPHVACLCPSGGPADSLASKVEVQVPAGGDESILVRVRNRGRYGASQAYALQVIEVVGDMWGGG